MSDGYIDLVGATELVGADDDISSLMGADYAVGAARAGQLPPGARQVAQMARPATRAREYPLGFVSAGTVAAGATATIQAQPQIVFRGERLIVPSDIAGSFIITQLIVGKNPQFVNPNAIHCRTFAENGVGVRLHMDTAQISQIITITVTNISGAAATFYATLIGTAVE